MLEVANVNVAVPKEIVAGERRVAVVPDVAGRIAKSGNAVSVERAAGDRAGFGDQAYEAVGARIVADASELYAQAEMVLKVQRPRSEEIQLLPEGSALVAFLNPLGDPEFALQLARRRVTAFAMELIPRISRAQSMDALSSQATCAGYKAVLIAASTLPKFFPMLMTAAGTVAPAKVFVIGAGVAGLQAIATARRLGAVVSAFDVRPIVKEQVESLGATFVQAEEHVEAEGTGGYAKALTEDQQERERQAIAGAVAQSDVTITTALVPGRRAPVLVTQPMVNAMRSGSVIVDLAAEAGGNCALTQPGETIAHGGVTIAGPLNVAATMPFHASQLYAKNVLALFDHLVKDGTLNLDMSDEITRGVCVTANGEIVNAAVQARIAAGGAHD